MEQLNSNTPRSMERAVSCMSGSIVELALVDIYTAVRFIHCFDGATGSTVSCMCSVI